MSVEQRTVKNARTAAQQRARRSNPVIRAEDNAKHRSYINRRYATDAKYRKSCIEAARRWNSDNPGRKLPADPVVKKLNESVRRARRRAATIGKITKVDWNELLTSFGNCCAYCLKPNGIGKDKLTLDHFRPLAKGGTHSKENIVPACRSCNSSKHDSLIFDWIPRFEAQRKFKRVE